MAKGGRSRRPKGDPESDQEDNFEKNNDNCSKASHKGMSFTEKRDHQRQAAADKRRSKMKCHLCGQAGHVRRECPGIADDGRGESKYTKSNGDVGATVLKKGKDNRQRGQKDVKEEEVGYEYEHSLPPGFQKNDDDKEGFNFFDAGFDAMESLAYLRSGRGKNKSSMKEAMHEYDSTMDEVSRTSNFGSGISRTHLSKLKPWTLESSFPFQPNNIFFVLGLGADFQCCSEETEDNVTLLTETIRAYELIVGLFADIDFSPKTLRDPKQGRHTQIERLRCALKAASENNCPVQIKTNPPPRTISDGHDGKEVEDDPYSEVIIELCKVLLEATSCDQNLKIHFSCWSGTADHMTLLLKTFPNNIWFGFDGAVTFSKATHLHECAFDLPLSKLLLQTGSPRTIPSEIAKSWGREAFCHSGLIPHIAHAVAHRKDALLVDVTAEMVAKNASENTLTLYPKVF